MKPSTARADRSRKGCAVRVFRRSVLVIALFAPGPLEGSLGVEQTLVEANALIEIGRYEQAEDLLTAMLESHPESASAYAVLGRAQALNRRWLRAEESLRRALELGQTDLQTLVFLGSAFWENTRFDEAEAVYKDAIEQYPGSLYPKYQLGRLWLWQGRYEEAVGYLRQAAARNPAPDVLLDLAEGLRGVGERDEAIAAYLGVVERAPDLMKAHYGLALLLQQKGDAARAQRHLAEYYELYELDQAAARSSELARGEIDRGRDLMRRDEITAAIEHLKTLPPSVESLIVLAEAYNLADQPEKSIETLERAVVLDPGNGEIRRRLSEARLTVESRGG